MELLGHGPKREIGLRRARWLLVVALTTAAIAAIGASSASALQWWVGTPSAPRELKHGEQLPIDPEGSVKSDFTLKWDKKRFEVKCGGVSYDGLYLEGPIFMGATSIAFKECVSKKPKNSTVVGGEIVTTPLLGEITGEGPNVGFHFDPTGATLASFEIKGTSKPHHKGAKFHSKECTYAVTATGSLSGSLGKAEKITTEKTFEFEGTSVHLEQSRSCVSLPMARHAARRAGAKPLGTKTLTLVTPKGPLAPGAPIVALSKNATVSGGGVTVECKESELGGELTANGASTDLATVLSTRNVGGEEGGRCHSGVGADEVVGSNTPWNVELGSGGQEFVTGHNIVYTSHFSFGLICTYEATTVQASLSFKGQLTASVAGQKYTLNQSASNGECAPEAVEKGTFAFTSGGEPVSAELAGESGGKEAKEEKELEEEEAKEAEEIAEEKEVKPVEGTKGKTGYSAFEGWGVL